MDIIKGTILDEGTIKSTTDAISATNHTSADKFFKHLTELMAGETVVEKRKDIHGHAHDHGHTHEHN